jgi:ATP-dependent protease HslVU (ClpYQ) peptidase subunit
MTIVCGIHEKDIGTFIGSDSRVTNRSVVVTDNMPKWINISGTKFWVGMSGDIKALVLVENIKLDSEISTPWELSKIIKDELDKDNWVTNTNDTGSKSYGIGVLIASPAGLYDTSADLAPVRIPDNKFYAVGSGRDFALGAAFTSKSKDIHKIIVTAIKASINFDPYCGGEIFTKFIC